MSLRRVRVKMPAKSPSEQLDEESLIQVDFGRHTFLKHKIKKYFFRK
jgi:hypothetical protein